MINTVIENKLKKFISAVKNCFLFLEKDFGYDFIRVDRVDEEDLRDFYIRIIYKSKVLGVEIGWFLMNATIGVSIFELEKGKIPEKFSFYGEKKFPRLISLTHFVEMKTKGNEKNPLSFSNSTSSVSNIKKLWVENDRIINEKMEWVLSVYANWLKKYASEILEGDTTSFQSIQEYTKKKEGL